MFDLQQNNSLDILRGLVLHTTIRIDIQIYKLSEMSTWFLLPFSARNKMNHSTIQLWSMDQDLDCLGLPAVQTQKQKHAFLQENTANWREFFFPLISQHPLPSDYYQLAVGYLESKQKKTQQFAQIIKAFPTLSSEPAIIKSLTLVLKSLEENRYDGEFLQELENMESPPFETVPELKIQWLRELFISMKSYLLRLSSLDGVLRRALLKANEPEKGFNFLLSDLYLLINLLGLLFPYLINTFNTIGRYYLKTNSYFFDFYNVISNQLLLIYNYLRYIVSFFIKEHATCPLDELKCFIKTLPEIQLLCDKMEELLLNKYFKGRGPSPKIYLKEEEVAKITYHIKQSEAGDLKKGSSLEEVNTAEDEFGQYQF